MNVYGKGSVANLDIYIYNFNGVNNSLIDPDGYPTNTEPTVTIKDAYGNTIISNQLATRVSIGYYIYQYTIPTNYASGTWKIIWNFTVNGNVPLESTRTEDFSVVDAGAVKFVEESLINELRILLKDTHPDSHKRLWVDAELSMYLKNALWHINVTPPSTYFFLDSSPLYYNSVPDWKGLIIQGAFWFAHLSQASMEIRKAVNITDNGVSYVVDRTSNYMTLANTMFQSFNAMVIAMKKTYLMKFQPQLILSSQAGSPDLSVKLATYAPNVFRFR